jgi:hypothetical protein
LTGGGIEVTNTGQALNGYRSRGRRLVGFATT